MNGIFANYLWTMFWGSVFWIFWIMWFFPRKYKYRCIRVCVWFKNDKHVIWMWIWLILKKISLLDRIWSLWLVRFAQSPPSFIFLLGRLIFSVSINSHPDNIYVFGRIVLNWRIIITGMFFFTSICVQHDFHTIAWRLIVTRLIFIVDQELLTLPEHLGSPADFSGVRVVQFLVFCVLFFCE